MRKVTMRTRIGLGLLLAGAAFLQPPSRATSNFTFYVDINSAGTTTCDFTCPAAACATPTCGSQAVPCHKIQDAVNIANCNIGVNDSLEADVIVAAGTYPEHVSIFTNIHVIGAGR